MWERYTNLSEIKRIDEKRRNRQSLLDMLAGAGLLVLCYALAVMFLSI